MVTQDFESTQEEGIHPELSNAHYLQQLSNIPDTNFFTRNHMIIKAILIGLLTLFLMIPTVLIAELISDRERTAREATTEVSQKWSGTQTLLGPVLSIPKNETTIGKDGKIEKTTNVIQILPETLSIRGEVKTQKLKRGLYEIVVYNAPIELTGSFSLPEELGNLSQEALDDIFFEDAMLNIGISDLRGISEQVNMNWSDQRIVFNPGIRHTGVLSSGVSSHVDIKTLLNEGVVKFMVGLELKGSEKLRFTPIGKSTVINLNSNCTTPSFTGAFLPVDREVNDEGFTSEWKVMHLNRNYPQVITGSRWESDMEESEFGVDMLLPVQHYQKSMRTVKYAILIIVLTFVVSFFVEVLQKKRIHPFQYLLIGMALCLFYSLLISISEHTDFTIAYSIASVMTVTLITCYLTGVLKIKKTALAIGGLLSLLYLCIFVLIQLETYALLAGSIGLFVILAAIMYVSQRINWNGR